MNNAIIEDVASADNSSLPPAKPQSNSNVISTDQGIANTDEEFGRTTHSPTSPNNTYIHENKKQPTVTPRSSRLKSLKFCFLAVVGVFLTAGIIGVGFNIANPNDEQPAGQQVSFSDGSPTSRPTANPTLRPTNDEPDFEISVNGVFTTLLSLDVNGPTVFNEMCAAFAPLFNDKSVCFDGTLHFCVDGRVFQERNCNSVCGIVENTNCDNELLFASFGECRQAPLANCPFDQSVFLDNDDDKITELQLFLDFLVICPDDVFVNGPSLCFNNNLQLICTRQPIDESVTSTVFDQCPGQCACRDEAPSTVCLTNVGCPIPFK